MTDSVAPDLQALLAEEPFVRSLARDLLGDASRADDVVQQAYMAALHRPPRHAGAVRSWFRQVVRRLAWHERQQATARRGRETEAQAASPQAAPSTAEVLEREATRRQLLEILLSLPQRYREVLLLRFYDGLPPRQIAARLQQPAGTVRSNISRGLALMRQQLDRENDGDRRSWCLALVPLATSGGRAAVAGGAVSGAASIFTSLGGFLMHKTTLTALTTALLLLFGSLPFWPEDIEEPVPAGNSQNVARTNTEQQPETLTSTAERQEVSEPDTAAQGREPTAQPSPFGQLVHQDGKPAAGVAYWLREVASLPKVQGVSYDREMVVPDDHQTTDSEGRFPWPKTTGKQVILWCQVVPSCMAGFDMTKRPDGARLHLPAVANLVIRCLGIQDEDRWRLMIAPIEKRDNRWHYGGRWLLLPEPKEGQASVLVASQSFRRFRGPGPITVPMLRGVTFDVSLHGTGFQVFPPTEKQDGHLINAHAAPSEVVFNLKARTRTLPIEILEQDGVTDSDMPAMLQVVTPRGRVYSRRLQGKHHALDTRRWPQDQDFPMLVLLDDGELFRAILRMPGSGPVEPIRIVRGQGRPPLRFRIEDGPVWTREDCLILENQDGIMGYGPSHKLDVFLTQRGVFRVAKDGRSAFMHTLKPWKRLLLAKKSGALAEMVMPASGTTGVARWHKVQKLKPLHLQDHYRRLAPNESTEARIEFELRVNNSEGKPTWLMLDRHFYRPTKKVRLDPKREAWPVWKKVVPAGMPYRFLMHLPGRDPLEIRPR